MTEQPDDQALKAWEGELYEAAYQGCKQREDELRTELDKQHRIFERVHDLAANWWTRKVFDWDDQVYQQAGREILDAMMEAQNDTTT